MANSTKCTGCGAQLVYKPGTKVLVCTYCGTQVAIDSKGTSSLESEEQEFFKTLRDIKNNSLKSYVVTSSKCSNCGGEVRVADHTMNALCPYCGSNKVTCDTKKQDSLAIKGIAPFSFDTQTAINKYKDWLDKKFFCNASFKKSVAKTLKVFPLYLPYYTFDANTVTNYIGERGTEHTRTVWVRDSEGNSHPETETYMTWTPVSGVCYRNFDDLVVCAFKDVSNAKLLESNCDFYFDKLEVFNDNFLAGYYAASPSVDLEDGYSTFKVKSKPYIENKICNQIGGDDQRIISMTTNYSGVTFKTVLAPIYNGFVEYRGSQYPVTINGQTGRIVARVKYGAKLFWTIIFPAILVTILFIIAIYMTR